jgi:anhydro-N-acetylmuramic acid kinase
MVIKPFKIIGLMSGTSLDGLDIAACTFIETPEGWQFCIDDAVCVDYPDNWKKRLQNLTNASAFEFAETHASLGKYFGKQVQNFIQKRNLQVDLISSHGHTIFHEPAKGFTSQIGDGAAIHAETGLPVVCDFRTVDVHLGGQGAPLVPIGDELLFPQYDYLLNLGGIANVSYAEDGVRKAFDISPCNIILNALAREKRKEFDEGGQMASAGKIDQELLQKLNGQEYYKLPLPKSLDKTYIENVFLPEIKNSSIPVEDKLATAVEHISGKIAVVIKGTSGRLHQQNRFKQLQVLVTGGGAFNTFLINKIREKSEVEIIIPDEKLVKFKEALVFAFLGLLRVLGRENILSSYTGAKRNSIGGAVYGGPSFLEK